VTSEPGAIAILKAQSMQSLPCSCGVLAHWLLILAHPIAFLLADCALGIADRALKLISALKFPPSEDVSLLTL
jgi:hypothetical protein